MLDLIIRNGTIVDGTGLPGYLGDIGIAGGRIASVGRRLPDGAPSIDATGRVVAPGFVDPHTHIDAQICFIRTRSPRSSTVSRPPSPATARSAWRPSGRRIGTGSPRCSG